MQSYGKFQAVRELYQTPLGAVWAARAAGEDGPPLACVKLIQPESAVFEGGGVEAAKEMLVAAAIQQSVANKAENWAPIYELGYDGQTAFYVTRLYERSLQRMIASKAKLTSEELLTICSAIVDALMSLQAAHQRPHGNLKPANVLLAGKGRIRQESVALTDPYPGDPDVASATRSPDTKALGEIIFSLVTGRPYTAARWPVQNGSEWNRLGSSGQQWLGLSNDLLNTMAREGPLSLEEIQSRLNQMRKGPRRLPASWFAVAAMIGLIACGYVYRGNLKQAYSQMKTRLARTSPAHTAPATQPHPSLIASAPVTHAPNTPPGPSLPVFTSPVPAPIPAPIPVPPPVVTVAKPQVTPPVNAVVVDIKPPAFLPPGAAKKFTDILNDPAAPMNAAAKQRFTDAVSGLEQQYLRPTIDGQLPWQKKLQATADQKWDDELTIAVGAVTDSGTADPSSYRDYLEAISKFNKEAGQSETAINLGTAWTPVNAPRVQTAIADKINLFDDSAEGTQVTPVVLQEMQRIEAAHDAQGLRAVVHDSSVSLPGRVAAWQRLCDPALNPDWGQDRADFVADQTDGDGLIKAADSAPTLKQAVSDLQAARLASFYSTLITQPLLTDAIEHASEIENNSADQRPAWFDFDTVLHKMKADHSAALDDLRKFKSTPDLPEFAAITSAMEKAAALAGNDQPLGAIGPGVLKDWAVRSDHSGCTYTNEAGNCPAVEFMRVEPTGKQGCTQAFYLATSNVTIELISAFLDSSSSAASRANAAMRHLNHADQLQPPPGVRAWKFKETTGIELDRDTYSRYFVQGTDDPKIPIQQITPQTAVYLARSLGCRLPTSAEWQAAYAAASNSSDDRVKRFAVSAWKLRDADFTQLVEKAVENSSAFPDEGAFLGADPSQVQTNAKATAWQAGKVHAMGGWTLAERSTDFGKEKIADLETISDDIGLDLLDPPEQGFRPVGNAQEVFHDLVGNVAEFVLDAPDLVSDQLPTGEHLSEKQITDWFASPGRMQQLGVIGGSFLSPPQLDPRVHQNLPATATDPMFADVGFRLAFTDPKEFADTATVIKNAPYAYPRQSPSNPMRKARILDNPPQPQ